VPVGFGERAFVAPRRTFGLGHSRRN
jgi:hypothetical protein